jgi:hypothetical protein
MASMGLDDDELKALETMVGRMAQLSSSIQSLKMDVLKSNPLPPTYVAPALIVPSLPTRMLIP